MAVAEPYLLVLWMSASAWWSESSVHPVHYTGGGGGESSGESRWMTSEEAEHSLLGAYGRDPSSRKLPEIKKPEFTITICRWTFPNGFLTKRCDDR